MSPCCADCILFEQSLQLLHSIVSAWTQTNGPVNNAGKNKSMTSKNTIFFIVIFLDFFLYRSGRRRLSKILEKTGI